MGRKMVSVILFLLGCSLDREPIAVGNDPVAMGPDPAGTAAEAHEEDDQSLAGVGTPGAGEGAANAAGSAGTGSVESGGIGEPDGGVTGPADMDVDAGPEDAATLVDASPGAADAPPSVDFFGMCSDDSQCFGQAACLRSDEDAGRSSWGGWTGGFSGMPVMSICSPLCATTSDCPLPVDAHVTVTCFEGNCILDCTGGTPCPSDAMCVDTDAFGPAPALCLWPLP